MRHKTSGIVSQSRIFTSYNNNTDNIIPARYLAFTTRDPKFYGDAFMHDIRYNANNEPVADFVMNHAPFNEVPSEGKRQIIIGGKNWGSGSSREHAAWAIAGYGTRVVISSYFAAYIATQCSECNQQKEVPIPPAIEYVADNYHKEILHL